MRPLDLKPDSFRHYPPSARELAVFHLEALRRLPLAFLPSLLRELIDYSEKFPPEQKALTAELDHLSGLTPAEHNEWFSEFLRLQLSPLLEQSDWVNEPSQFVEQLSAYLWSTHQLDLFRGAATQYGDRLRNAVPPAPPATPRLGIAIIGEGVSTAGMPLFRRLRAHGTYFSNVDPELGVQSLLGAAGSRAEKHPAPFAHWYVDGGQAAEHHPRLTVVSYQQLSSLRDALLKTIDAQVARPGMGPEQLRTHLARLAPADLGMNGDPVLDRFQLKLFTEGSGTQIFSTTFAQWTAREVLRRAQALTLVVRFAPRQRQRPISELLSSNQEPMTLDPEGSLVDADMASYYHWINQQRLTGGDKSSFIAWFEGHSQAVVIAPGVPRGAESSSRLNMRALLALTAG